MLWAQVDIHGHEVLPGRSPNVLRLLRNSFSHQEGELCDAWTFPSGSSWPAGKRTWSFLHLSEKTRSSQAWDNHLQAIRVFFCASKDIKRVLIDKKNDGHFKLDCCYVVLLFVLLRKSRLWPDIAANDQSVVRLEFLFNRLSLPRTNSSYVDLNRSCAATIGTMLLCCRMETLCSSVWGG